MNRTRGFIGLLALLIVCAITLYMMFGNTKTTPTETGGEEPKSIIETELEAKQKAQDIKAKLEAQSRNQAQEVESN